MKYKATIITDSGRYCDVFDTMAAAAQWLDRENKNMEATSIIETFDEAGEKKDGFFYTVRKK